MNFVVPRRLSSLLATPFIFSFGPLKLQVRLFLHMQKKKLNFELLAVVIYL